MKPVVCLPDSDRTLQVDVETNSWFVTFNAHCYAVSDEGDGTRLAALPFLELSLAEVSEAASNVLAQHPNLMFPYEIMIRAGFRHGSPHWTDCSLNWLAEVDTLETSFKDELEDVIGNPKRYSQKSRQLARKLINQGR